MAVGETDNTASMQWVSGPAGLRQWMPVVHVQAPALHHCAAPGARSLVEPMHDLERVVRVGVTTAERPTDPHHAAQVRLGSSSGLAHRRRRGRGQAAGVTAVHVLQTRWLSALSHQAIRG